MSQSKSLLFESLLLLCLVTAARKAIHAQGELWGDQCVNTTTVINRGDGLVVSDTCQDREERRRIFQPRLAWARDGHHIVEHKAAIENADKTLPFLLLLLRKMSLSYY